MDNFVDDDVVEPTETNPEVEGAQQTESERALVQKIIREIKADRAHHDKAFKRMQRDMQIATWGADTDWAEGKYRANISGRHVKMKTAALFAKNPKVKASRRKTLDFAIWDENPASLQMAFQVMQSVKQLVDQAQAMPPQMDPTTGMLMAPPPPQIPPEAAQAQAMLEDFQQGLQRRTMIKKYGATLEVLFDYFAREQIPLDFKKGMKKVVRRACTTCVGYVELGFQREKGMNPSVVGQLADARSRLAHMQALAQEVAEGEIHEDDSEMAELQAAVASLEAEPEIVLREGLIFDYPESTKVIPDRLCRDLEGFIGARRVTIEYTYTTAEVEELFGIDLGNEFSPYSSVPGQSRSIGVNDVMDDDFEWQTPDKKRNDGLVRVWKCYDKTTGLVYYVADGYSALLRPAAAPDVFVETFWPLYALTFNAVENEKELYPPSDVALLYDMQAEYNRSREGLREHRNAARPRYVYAVGSVEEDDVGAISKMKPFEALAMNIDPQTEIAKVFQTMPTPGVDPNLYETNQLFTDIQLVGGAQEAQYGGTSQATATESAIAAGATNSSDGSSIEDLDSFLSTLARAAGQIMQREMSEEKVKEIVGPGAVWPQMTLAEIAKEVSLTVEAGSTGKPNQAVEINNWKQMGPILMQTPGVSPSWFAKETIRRLDDGVDMVEALAEGLPSIMAMNGQAQVNQSDAASDPNAQGASGSANTPAPARPEGSSAAFGSNQV